MAHSRESLIRDVARFAKARKGKLSLKEFCAFCGFTPSVVNRRFHGGFTELLGAARLSARQRHCLALTNSRLLEEVDRVVRVLGREPNWEQLRDRGRYSIGAYHRRFRGIGGILGAYRDWVARGRPRSAAPAAAGVARANGANSYGVPLGFRGLLHAPVTESGVVHLFGVLGAEMGYSVLRIRPGYPDCEAVRRHRTDPGRWERIEIEFELNSSNFQGHGHDASKCDVIVCWEHDWPECPLGVVELRSELTRLGALEAPGEARWAQDLWRRARGRELGGTGATGRGEVRSAAPDRGTSVSPALKGSA